MKIIKVQRISYSPGYGDMLGGGHSVSLRKDNEGNWNYISRDQEDHTSPTVTTVYAVSGEAVKELSEFISKKKIISLENRRDSDLFATDYSPWSWNVDYETTSFGKTKIRYCALKEYKNYKSSDYELLKELRERFYALKGEKISETVETEEE